VKTLIVGPGRVVTRTQRRIDQAAATRLATGLPLTAAVAFDLHTIDLWPDRELTTLEEVRATAVFTKATDARLCWHEVHRPVPPTCVMCDTADVELVHDLCGRCAAMFAVAQ